MFKTTLLVSVFSGVIMMANHVMAGEGSPERSELPATYQLEDVRISVLHQTGHRLPGSYTIQIRGDGQATQEIDQQATTELTLPDETLVDLLKDFYRIHFFELQDTYTIKKQIALLEDRSIVTSGYRLVDMSSQRLCLAIGGYEKCVTIMDEQPLAASQLVKKIEALFTKKVVFKR